MTKLPSSEKVILVLLKNNFTFKSQKGSHQKYVKSDKVVIVPSPGKQIPIGTLKSISKQAGITYHEFVNL
ncbi:MAG TPA: type II toxin-antitoxin system HicA family toxin [Saprospiraceae bacterium]|nr:type II toxin-antitoxin system HicA family toxin [Saprospiraceae bacterium]